MIIEMIIENILSFKDRVTFKFNNNVINIIGNNNTGKTNLLKVLNSLSLMIRNNNNTFNTYMFNDNTSSFEITFIKNNIKYIYGFKNNRKVIEEEYLYYYSNKNKLIIYERNNSKYKFENNKLKTISKGVLNTNLLLSNLKDYDKVKDVYSFLTLDLGICLDIRSLFDLSFKIYERDTNHKLKEYILNFFKKCNINITDYKIRTVIINNNKGYQTKFKHNINNNNYIIDYGSESLSIRTIFALLPFILMTIENKRILIIDDLDSILDYKTINLIIEMFKEKAASLIFTTHNDYNFNCDSINLNEKTLDFTSKLRYYK